MKRINLGLAVHNHQPVGNFPWVFEDACSRAYLPMLEALRRHPGVKMSLHYSGPLIDWLLEKRPEFFDMLKELASKGQVELMGGGYYEPALPSIPDVDRYGQIEKMSRFIASELGSRPRGLWLAERVWEPYLAAVLPAAGVEWTMVDDTAFKMVGKRENDLFGYYLTEDQGRYLKVFPISKYLRYAIPWYEVGRVIEYFRDNATGAGDRIAVLGDDGEKFGVWPETYEHCWEKGWVEDFFTALDDNSEWLSTVRLGDYLKQAPPAGRAYLPCAAYDEMLEWSLPADKSREYTALKHRLEDEGRNDILSFMNSGFWRNFMVKYPEANRMHKRMLLVSDKVHRANGVDGTAGGLDDMWKAQCNCPYWHGVFGGIYLSDIRAGTYANLIKAENYADRVLWTLDRGYIDYRLDFDGDGNGEVIVEGRKFNLYVSPAEGGSIIEWDLKDRDYNLISTMRRTREAYHEDLVNAQSGEAPAAAGEEIRSIHDVLRVKLSGPVGPLVYDSLPRSGLIDCFVEPGMTMQRWQNNDVDLPNEFAGQPYECSVGSGEKGLAVKLWRTGMVKSGEERVEVLLEKTLSLPDKEEKLEVSFRIANKGNKPLRTLFASEWNINLLGGGRNPAAFYRCDKELEDEHMDSSGEIQGVQELDLVNRGLGIDLAWRLDRPLTVWRFPVESLSNSEGGIEMVYQCSCLVVLLPLELAPGKKAEFSYTWSLRK